MPNKSNTVETVERKPELRNEQTPAPFTIASLANERNVLLQACKETLRQLDAPDCPDIPDGAMVRGRLVNAITKAEGRVN